MQEDDKIEEYIKTEDFEIKEKIGWMTKFDNFLSGKYFVPTIIILVAIIAFSLGRLSKIDEGREPVRVLNTLNGSPPNSSSNLGEGSSATAGSGANFLQNTAAVGASQRAESTESVIVVGSKNGTKYHYPWCAGAKQISEKNLITFSSIEEARAKGYSPAANCKGLK